VAERSALIVSVQAPVPVQAPDQPANFDLDEAEAVSVTEVPCGYACEQVEPQAMPAGLELTEPEPLPAFATARVLSDSNVAVAAWSALIVSVQVPVPEQSPDQPVKVEPTEAAAVNVTGTAAKGAEQVEPQSMPAGLELTVPAPDPAFVTVSVLPR